MSNGLDVRTPDHRLVELEHVPRRAVDHLQLALAVDDDHALDHAGEDRFHAPAIARLLLEPASDLLDGVVECPRHVAQLVVAESETRWREITAAIAARDIGDDPHALADP